MSSSVEPQPNETKEPKELKETEEPKEQKLCIADECTIFGPSGPTGPSVPTVSCNKMIVYFNQKYPKGINKLLNNDPSIIEKYYKLLQAENPNSVLKTEEIIEEANIFFKYMWVKYLKDFYSIARKYEIVRNIKKSAIFDFSLERTFFDVSVTENLTRLFRSKDSLIAYRCINFYYGFFRFNDFLARMKKSDQSDEQDLDKVLNKDFETFIKEENIDKIIERLDKQETQGEDDNDEEHSDENSDSGSEKDNDEQKVLEQNEVAEQKEVAEQNEVAEQKEVAEDTEIYDMNDLSSGSSDTSDTQECYSDEGEDDEDCFLEEEIVSDDEFKEMIARYE